MPVNMLRPLLYLFALISLGDAAPEQSVAAAPVMFTTNKEFNISSCPITFYEKVYSKLYVKFTSKSFWICFNGFYSTSSPDDCIKGPAADEGSATFSLAETDSMEAEIKEKVSTIINSMECAIEFETYRSGSPLVIILASFGNQTALKLSHASLITDPSDPYYYTYVNAYVEGNRATSTSVYSGTSVDFTDISGCRALGEGYQPTGAYEMELGICTLVKCNLDRSVVITPQCKDEERCDGYGICLMSHTCTVTGPSIIDIHGGVDFVEDRCSYTLVDSDLELTANFQERRRKDVSFVDSVLLQLNGDDIILQQGGRVLMNSLPLTLNSSVQDVDGVKFFQDDTGVHATVEFYMNMAYVFATVFFDGDTAQIDIEVPVGSSLDGLCGNSSRVSAAKLSGDGSSGCDTLHIEAADSTIDCDAVTQRCNVLMEAPFSSCNAEVDPAPYITACTQTLCKYPAGDGLSCQFLGAYARACSLKNASLEEWWSEAGCSAPEPFCQDKVCSDHEFCGMKSSGDKGCLCRAVFASSYKESNSLGGPTVCTENSASVSLVACLLEERNIDYTLLHLNDESCKGEKDEDSMVTFSFNSSNTCGAVITANDSQVTYKNTIMAQNISSEVITRRDQFSIDFSCVHVQPEMKTVAFRIRDSSVVQHITSGEWNYTVTMTAYTDAGRTQAVGSDSDVALNQKIWVELDTEGLDADLISVVTDSCWATDQESSSSTPRYDLIQNGCANAADQTVMVEGNGEGTSNSFSFSMFQFSGSSGDVYLHCKLNLCVTEGSSCVPGCSGGVALRRRRSTRYKHGASAFISMAWIN